jgi:hypothetical protein
VSKDGLVTSSGGYVAKITSSTPYLFSGNLTGRESLLIGPRGQVWGGDAPIYSAGDFYPEYHHYYVINKNINPDAENNTFLYHEAYGTGTLYGYASFQASCSHLGRSKISLYKTNTSSRSFVAEISASENPSDFNVLLKSGSTDKVRLSPIIPSDVATSENFLFDTVGQVNNASLMVLKNNGKEMLKVGNSGLVTSSGGYVAKIVPSIPHFFSGNVTGLNTFLVGPRGQVYGGDNPLNNADMGDFSSYYCIDKNLNPSAPSNATLFYEAYGTGNLFGYALLRSSLGSNESSELELYKSDVNGRPFTASLAATENSQNFKFSMASGGTDSVAFYPVAPSDATSSQNFLFNTIGANNNAKILSVKNNNSDRFNVGSSGDVSGCNFARRTTRVSASVYAAGASDSIIFCNASTGNILVILPNPSGNTRQYDVKKIDHNATGVVTVSGAGGASITIDGYPRIQFSGRNESYTFVPGETTGYYII